MLMVRLFRPYELEALLLHRRGLVNWLVAALELDSWQLLCEMDALRVREYGIPSIFD